MADECGVVREMIAVIENRKKHPPINTLIKILEPFGYTLSITKMNKLALFEEKEIRKTWQDEKWYFSVEDIVTVLTNSKDPKQYIDKLRQRDEELKEGRVQIVHSLKMETRG